MNASCVINQFSVFAVPWNFEATADVLFIKSSYFVLLLPLLPLYSTFVVIENCACFLSTQNIYIATSVYYTLAVLFTLESGHLLFPFKQQLKPANDTSFNCNDSENTNLAPCIFLH